MTATRPSWPLWKCESMGGTRVRSWVRSWREEAEMGMVSGLVGRWGREVEVVWEGGVGEDMDGGVGGARGGEPGRLALVLTDGWNG